MITVTLVSCLLKWWLAYKGYFLPLTLAILNIFYVLTLCPVSMYFQSEWKTVGKDQMDLQC